MSYCLDLLDKLDRREKKTLLIVFLVCTVGIWTLDGVHQREIAELNKAYTVLEQGEEERFSDALSVFKKYYDSHGDIYWDLQKRYGNVRYGKEAIGNILISMTK